ncbi:MAG: hypothetical protein JWM87_4669 [Candidatus Eremiobacteraeota bacterium]|nr:hypothetical protein [Candidatus Eremiobacteraeota bacterium]
MSEPLLAGASPALFAAAESDAVSAEVVSALGPYADLVGTWQGDLGWNLVAVPGKPFDLLVQQYTETITFSPMLDIPNRRMGAPTSFLAGLEYSLQIFELDKPTVSLHEENGMWLLLGDGTDAGDDVNKLPTIARQATVPHGDSVLALGGFTDQPRAPQYPKIEVLPVIYGQAGFDYFQQYNNQKGAAGELVKDPCSLLAAALPNTNIDRTITFTARTDAYPQGGLLNIPFIQKYADASLFAATMWLAYESSASGTPDLTLQYAQLTMIDFAQQPDQRSGLIKWPHIDINTLKKVN